MNGWNRIKTVELYPEALILDVWKCQTYKMHIARSWYIKFENVEVSLILFEGKSFIQGCFHKGKEEIGIILDKCETDTKL